MVTARRRQKVVLDPEMMSPEALSLESSLRSSVVGQERSIRYITVMYQMFRAGLSDSHRPIGIALFMGPTGSGKTYVVEAAARSLFGDSNAIIKIDCAEFQHSHETAKLIGAPPGYLGHGQTDPVLTQSRIDSYHNERAPFTFLLFDEIEKASDALWKLLLGILDKATLTLGDNTKVDFSKTVIFMTSNLAAQQMKELVSGAMGFAPSNASSLDSESLDQKMYRVAVEEARRKFPPEFMNRIDKIVVFRGLTQDHLRRIVDLELDALQHHLNMGRGTHFTFTVTRQAKEFLLAEGSDLRYGARHIKRAIQRWLVPGLANLISTEQVKTGDTVIIDFDQKRRRFTFFLDVSTKIDFNALFKIAQPVEKISDTGCVAV